MDRFVPAELRNVTEERFTGGRSSYEGHVPASPPGAPIQFRLPVYILPQLVMERKGKLLSLRLHLVNTSAFLNELSPKPGRSYIQHQGQTCGTFRLLTGDQGPHIHLLFHLPSQHGTSKGPSLPTPPSSTSLPWQACLPQLASPTPPHLLLLFLLGCSLL